MKQHLKKTLVTIALLAVGLEFASNGFATGGINVGTAGDWRKTLISNAKRGAANWVNSVAINLNVVTSDPVANKEGMTYKFLVYPGSLVKLAADIIASQHIYNTEIESVRGEYTTCAWTNDPARPHLTDIVFSLKLCEGGLTLDGQKYANRLLIHESVHHLLLGQNLRNAIGANFSGDLEAQKQQEDELCDEIAATIQRLFESISLRESDHWQDIAGPFHIGVDSSALVERGYHVSAWTGITGNPRTQDKMIIWGGCNQGIGGLVSCGDEGYLGDGAIYDPKTDRWSQITPQGAPSPRAESAFVWTGDQLAIWGGCVNGDGCEKKLGDGAFYAPATDAWTPIASSEHSPTPRVHHSMVWTGKSLIVWGGYPQDHAPYFAAPLSDGALYDASTKEWHSIPKPVFTDGTTFAARGHHHAFWTGDTGNTQTSQKMLIIGGCMMEVADRCPHPFNDGALFDPKTGKWQRLVAMGTAPKARHAQSILYVPNQQKIYIFGGIDARGNFLSDGSVLDLATLTWDPMPNLSEGRAMHSAVWANDRMLIFGGVKQEYSGITTYEDKVISFVPGDLSEKKPSWNTVITNDITPLKAIHHSAFWTGDSMIVWGGQTAEQQFTNLGSRLFLNTLKD